MRKKGRSLSALLLCVLSVCSGCGKTEGEIQQGWNVSEEGVSQEGIHQEGMSQESIHQESIYQKDIHKESIYQKDAHQDTETNQSFNSSEEA